METRDDREPRTEDGDAAPPPEWSEDHEMGGEAPCQLHRWMDVDGDAPHGVPVDVPSPPHDAPEDGS